MAQNTNDVDTTKKEYGTVKVSLVLTKEQIDACSKAAAASKDVKTCVSKVAEVLNDHEEDIMSKGYEPEVLSMAIGTALFPAIEKLRKEGKLDENSEDS